MRIPDNMRRTRMLARLIAEHGFVRDSYFFYTLKPSRKGTANGNGKGKLPNLPIRVKITTTPLFKEMVFKLKQKQS